MGGYGAEEPQHDSGLTWTVHSYFNSQNDCWNAAPILGPFSRKTKKQMIVMPSGFEMNDIIAIFSTFRSGARDIQAQSFSLDSK
jgi:hypothetical protein